ncbi:MAG: ATP-binding protein [Bacteroidota bacterium]|nr:ATP-binding protein [Bacteroidota bacterium]
MRRDIYSALLSWKAAKNRQPLLIRGARQTGKTYIINEFGQTEYKSLITLNFERNPEYKDIFSTFDPQEILERISLYTGKKIESGETLLFLDEIQECPKAITSLRYFYEEMPQIHIIAAGSLLEFTLSSENFRMPVGRIQYLFLFPLSFGEFLTAIGESELRAFVVDISKLEKTPENLHLKLIEYVRKYFIIGGMPAVVQEYISTRNIFDCQKIQRSILDTYSDDFAKYARKSKHQYLKKVFNAVPGMVGQKFVYTQVDREIKSRDLKEALELLETAGVVNRIRQVNGVGLPLAASINESYFKVIFLDVGLLHAISGIYAETAMEKDLAAIFKGAVAEQFAGQELIAYQNTFTKPTLFYWGRQAKNSTAEIDYLIELDAQIIPVEIKSGSTGRMKSLHFFIDYYLSKKAVKISQAPFLAGNPILSLPFYAMESIFNSMR